MKDDRTNRSNIIPNPIEEEEPISSILDLSREEQLQKLEEANVDIIKLEKKRNFSDFVLMIGALSFLIIGVIVLYFRKRILKTFISSNIVIQRVYAQTGNANQNFVKKKALFSFLK